MPEISRSHTPNVASSHETVAGDSDRYTSQVYVAGVDPQAHCTEPSASIMTQKATNLGSSAQGSRS